MPIFCLRIGVPKQLQKEIIKYMQNRAFLTALLFLFLWVHARSQQALVLSNISIFQDSSFSAENTGLLKKGTLVDVLAQSGTLHEDKTQTQQFHWFLVKDAQGQTGWAMGDELAILSLTPSRFKGISQMTGGPYSIGKGFEQSVFYWGETNGKDDLSSHFSARNEYHENYLVFVNPNNQTKFLPVGTQSERGNNICIGLYFADLTQNGYQEIIVTRSLSGKEMEEEVRKLEIYQIVDGDFKLIFEQRLNIYFEPGITSPGRFKFVDISPDGIRLEYPQYEKCAKTHFGVPITKEPVTYQKCLSWITESYTWDRINNRFSHFYQPSALPFRARTKKDVVFLRERPSLGSPSIQLLHKKDRLKVIAHLETISTIKKKKVVRVFFLVKSSDGIVGYLPSDQVEFVQAAHASILNQFYAHPLLIKRDWRQETQFVRLRGFANKAHWEVTGNFTEN